MLLKKVQNSRYLCNFKIPWKGSHFMMHIIEDLRHNRRIPCLWSQFEPLLQNIMCLIAHLTNTVKYAIIVRKVYLVTDLLSGS